MGSSTPTPWARGNASVRQVVKTQNRDMAQQRRETVDVTKPDVFSSDGGILIIPGRREMPTKAGAVITVNADEDAYELKMPASGGGVTGVTRLTAGSIVQSNAASPVGSSVTLADYSIAPLWGEALPITEGTSGRISLPAGAYQAHAWVRLAWDGSATVDEVRLSADFAGADPYPLRYAALGTEDGHGGTPSLRDDLAWGPFHVDEGGWTFFGVTWMTADHAYLSAAAIDVWRVG